MAADLFGVPADRPIDSPRSWLIAALNTEPLFERAAKLRVLILVWLECTELGGFSWSGARSIAEWAEAWQVHRGSVWRYFHELSEAGLLESMNCGNGLHRLKPAVPLVSPLQQRLWETDRDGDLVAILRVAVSRPRVESLTDKEEANHVREEEDSLGVAVSRRAVSRHPPKRDQRRKLLIEGGVVPPLIGEILALPHATESYIAGHLQRVKIAKGEGVGLAVRRMQAGLAIPEFCSMCHGVDGRHRYVDTEHEGLSACPRERYAEQDEIAAIFGRVSVIDDRQ